MRISKSAFLVVFAALLAGCASTKKVDVDLTVSEVIPRSAALEFLQGLDHHGQYRCAYSEQGMYGTPPFGSNPRQTTPYNTWVVSNVAATDQFVFVVVNKGSTMSEFCEALYLPKENVGPEIIGNDRKAIRKTITALVSLGVKYDPNNLSFFN